MKSLVLMFLMVIPSIGFSDWEKVGADPVGINYIDFDRVEARDHFIYYYNLLNFYEPMERTLSMIHYIKANCITGMLMTLQYSEYEHHNGKRHLETTTLSKSDWYKPYEFKSKYIRTMCAQSGS